MASDCFPGVDIPGGVCFFKWDRDNSGLCDVTVYSDGKESRMIRPLLEKGCDVFIKYNEAVSIVKKVMVMQQKNQTMDVLLTAQRPFGLPTN